ncbi:MAG: amidohydrolase [Candidatus Bathyarchaeia archaeon]
MPTFSLLIKDCDWIVTQNASREILRNASLLVERGVIAEINPKESSIHEVDTVIDGKGKVLMPGLINAHTHASMTIFRGYADDMGLEEWLKERIWPLEARLDEELCYLGALLACLEMIKTGTTCFLDMYYHEKGVARAVEEAGLRAFLCQGFLDAPGDANRRSNPALRHFLTREAKDFIQHIKRLDNPRIKFAIGPHAPYTCSDAALLWAKKLGDLEEAPVHIHLAETRGEQATFESLYGKGEIEYLDELGFLSERTVAAHCAWITKPEIEILSQRKVKVVHCPVSNMKLGIGGVTPVPELLEAGVTVALGTDGPASNNSLDMFETMKVAALLQKQNKWDPRVIDAASVLEMATLQGAKALGIDAMVGSVEVGKEADLILVSLKDPNMFPIHGSKGLISNLVYSGKGFNVDTTIVAGRVLMIGRQVLSIKEEEVYIRFQDALKKLGLK